LFPSTELFRRTGRKLLPGVGHSAVSDININKIKLEWDKNSGRQLLAPFLDNVRELAVELRPEHLGDQAQQQLVRLHPP
jgi:hypothetical protein